MRTASSGGFRQLDAIKTGVKNKKSALSRKLRIPEGLHGQIQKDEAGER
jgi:hypothetical protein